MKKGVKRNDYLESLKTRASEQKKIFSKENFLADEIWNFFSKKIAFPRIMKIIKEKGYQAVYQIFNEIRHSKSKNPTALFLWKIKKEEIIWKNDFPNLKKNKLFKK